MPSQVSCKFLGLSQGFSSNAVPGTLTYLVDSTQSLSSGLNEKDLSGILKEKLYNVLDTNRRSYLGKDNLVGLDYNHTQSIERYMQLYFEYANYIASQQTESPVVVIQEPVVDTEPVDEVVDDIVDSFTNIRFRI